MRRARVELVKTSDSEAPNTGARSTQAALENRGSRQSPKKSAQKTKHTQDIHALSLDDIYFRVERQTLHAFTELDRYVFTIRIIKQTLSDVLYTPERCERFMQSLESMHPETQIYKSLTDKRQHILALIYQRKLDFSYGS